MNNLGSVEASRGMPMQRVPLYRAKLAVCESMDSDSAQLGPSQANLNFYSTTVLDQWPSLRKDTIVSMLCNRSCSVRIGPGGTCNRSLPAWSHLIYSLPAPLGCGLAFRTSVKGVVRNRSGANSTARDN